MYLYGKNSVFERIKTNPGSIKKVFLGEGFNTKTILDAIQSRNIPVERVAEKTLARIKRADRLQGIVALVRDFEYTDFEKLLEKGKNKDLSLICLDSINDPQNLGSIIRTAACFGGFAVVLPKHASCEVNDTVVHVACGGENFVPVSMVSNMLTALIKAKKAGYWVVGAVVERGQELSKTVLPQPVCLVLGSEGKGIRPAINKHLDLKVQLPMRGAALTFNVAMACAIFCHEISKQKVA